MPDYADIAGDNDFNEEKLKSHLNRSKVEAVPRGKCLFCEEPCAIGLYCNEDCRSEFEREDLIRRKTSRILRRT